jgi:hypothetical protein
VPEAPTDGQLYGRQSAAWAPAQPLDADLTSLAAATGTNTLYYRSALNTWSPVSIGAGLSFAGGVLSATGGGGGTPPGSMDFSAPSQSGLLVLLEDI